MLFSALRHPRRGAPEAYEWDENKRQETLKKRGIDFADMQRFEWDTAVFKPPWRHGKHKEWRQTALGVIAGRLYVAAFTARDKKLRIISLRKANNREIKSYNEQRDIHPEE